MGASPSCGHVRGACPPDIALPSIITALRAPELYSISPISQRIVTILPSAPKLVFSLWQFRDAIQKRRALLQGQHVEIRDNQKVE